MEIDKNKVDVTAVFIVYMTLVGDVNKTALAMNLDPVFVEELAESEGWKEKLRRMSMVSKSDEPGGWERMQNRALNFAQAHRLREFIDRMILHFADKTPEQLIDAFSAVSKSGDVQVSARFVADLASASEKVQMLSYHALGDSAPERKERGTGESESSAAVLHAAIIAALNSPMSQAIPANELVKKATLAIIDHVEQKSTGPREG